MPTWARPSSAKPRSKASAIISHLFLPRSSGARRLQRSRRPPPATVAVRPGQPVELASGPVPDAVHDRLAVQLDQLGILPERGVDQPSAPLVAPEHPLPEQLAPPVRQAR